MDCNFWRLRDGPAMGLLGGSETGAWVLEERLWAGGTACLRLLGLGPAISGLSSGVGDLENTGISPVYGLTIL